MKYKELSDFVYNYSTKHTQGFIKSEMEEVLSKFPGINMEKYNSAMMGNTCMLDENDGIITYHCDLLTALRCGLENRDVKWFEFD